MASPNSTKTTRILVVSDTHCHEIPGNIPSADVLLHCGDLTNCGSTDELEKALALLTSIDAELKLVIAGNHDTTLDHDYCYGRRGQPMFDYRSDARLHPETALHMWKSRTEAAGIKYLEEGTHTFRLKSGVRFTVYATPFQPGPGNWAFQYQQHQDRYNLPQHSLTDAKNICENPIPDNVHIVMSHGPMLNVLDNTNRGEPAGCPHLLRAVMRSKPMLHVCGHIHEGRGGRRIVWADNDVAVEDTATIQWSRSAPRCGAKSISRVRHENLSGDQSASYVDVSEESSRPLIHGLETLAINASILDGVHEPVQAPWLIDLDLPVVEEE